MVIKSAEFVISNTDITLCPTPNKPEFAFIGRSNVGKSSWINTLTQRKSLAKISGKPGKTQTINHFIINDQWYLVDLPGYGYASVSQNARKGWSKMIENYLTKRENLQCIFVLVDARLKPQKIDMEFITWLGEMNLPIAILLTKIDKLPKTAWATSQQQIEAGLLETWDALPPIFQTSAEKKTGREEVLDFIDKAMKGQL